LVGLLQYGNTPCIYVCSFLFHLACVHIAIYFLGLTSEIYLPKKNDYMEHILVLLVY
jgi:hypothetical protein